MAQLADMLSKQMDRPVIDMTGMPGVYDLTVDLSASTEEAAGKELPPAVKAKIMLGRSLQPIVEEQLGMKLEGRKLPADMLVIEHAERVPAEN